MAALSGDRRVNRDALRRYFSDFADETEGGLPLTRELYLLLGRASPRRRVAWSGHARGTRARTSRSRRRSRWPSPPWPWVTRPWPCPHVSLTSSPPTASASGPWVRIKANTAEATAVSTARLAIVAASLGDPIAADMDAEITVHPPSDTVMDLERVIAASRWADRVPQADGTAAVTIDGARTGSSPSAAMNRRSSR